MVACLQPSFVAMRASTKVAVLQWHLLLDFLWFGGPACFKITKEQVSDKSNWLILSSDPLSWRVGQTDARTMTPGVRTQRLKNHTRLQLQPPDCVEDDDSAPVKLIGSLRCRWPTLLLPCLLNWLTGWLLV